MSFSTAQIKDLLREIKATVDRIELKLAQPQLPPTGPVVNYDFNTRGPEGTPGTQDISKTATEAAKAEKRRIFLERMRVGREKAAERKGKI